jgi:hypothetical protein
VSINDEGRDMWKVYLDMKEYAAALANCRDPFQRDQVYLVQVTFICIYRDLIWFVGQHKFKVLFTTMPWFSFWLESFMVQAEAAFDSKDYFRAASFYAKVSSLFSLTILVSKCLLCWRHMPILLQLSSSNTWELVIIQYKR